MRAEELCRYANITYRQLDHWCRTGKLGPEYENAQRGRGYEREFTITMAKNLEVASRLMDRGFETNAALKIALTGEKVIYLGKGLTLRIEPYLGKE